jgi:predicted DNA binding CopG/RHH family protein
MTDKKFRVGPVGALIDEHERALNELIDLSASFSQTEFLKVVDNETKDENCRSVQTILDHVMRAGYAYSNYIREALNDPVTSNPQSITTIAENKFSQQKMFEYMLETMEGKYNLSENDLSNIKIKTRWGANLDAESLLEHAIVHLLRHRRQLEKFKILYF